MEQAVISLIDDIRDIEEDIYSRLQEGTFSEILIPSQPLGEAHLIQRDAMGQAYIELPGGENDSPLRLEVETLATPKFLLRREDIDEKKNMKRELTDQMATGLGGLWDRRLLGLFDLATDFTGQVIEATGGTITKDDIVELMNIFDREDRLSGGFLTHMDTFEAMPFWEETKDADVDYMAEAKERCAEEGVLLGKEMLLSAHRSRFKDLFCFEEGVELGRSLLGKPQISVCLDRRGIAIECRVLAARTITHATAIAKCLPGKDDDE
jgi:hypothetical protein